jgi:hypothetical protein
MDVEDYNEVELSILEVFKETPSLPVYNSKQYKSDRVVRLPFYVGQHSPNDTKAAQLKIFKLRNLPAGSTKRRCAS